MRPRPISACPTPLCASDSCGTAFCKRLVFGQSLFQPALLQQEPGPLQAHDMIAGTQFERPLQRCRRRRKLFSGHQQPRQCRPDLRQTGGFFQNDAKSFMSFVKATLVEQRIGGVVPRLEIVRLDRQRAPEAGHRFFVTAQPPQGAHLC